MTKILLIDDSKAVHAFITRSFQGADVELAHVFNGQDGIEHLKMNPGKYDLVMLDWEMPVLNGPGTLDELRAMAFSVPVIMMTTRNSSDDITSMFEKGVSEYLLKPFTSDILFDRVEQVLGKKVSNAA